jgi:aryl-alcohol dehydrogenase-like predicted oxidoreductase
MRYRSLGSTGLTVSEIGFGAWAIGGNKFGNSYGETQDDVSLAALHRAYDLGCTFFDTADVYGHGHSETLLGQALKSWERDRVVIATKVGGDFYSTPPRLNFSEKHVRFALEQSLQRLQTDVIDVYQLHNPSLALIQNGRVFELMKQLQQEGKIRTYGLSIFDPQEGLEAIARAGAQSIQAVYNLFDRRPERRLLAAGGEAGVGFIAREPLANGFLTGKFEKLAAPTPEEAATTASGQFVQGDIRANWPKPLLASRARAAQTYQQQCNDTYPHLPGLALKFVLAHPHVSVVIPGCKTVAQVEQNFACSDWPPLSGALLETLQQAEAVFA